MKHHLILILLVGCSILSACRDGGTSAGGAPTPPPAPKPGTPINCREFKDFSAVFMAMQKFKDTLNEVTTTSDRQMLASGLLADHLSRSYAIPKELQSGDKQAQEFYIVYLGWIFTEDGRVRSLPTHPLTKSCLEKE